jgi:alkaline phosphatase D
VLTGDVHSSWAIEVARDPWVQGYDPATGRGALAVEFVAPAVSSSPLGSVPGVQENFARDPRPNVRYMDLWQHGYALLDLDRERAQAEWWYVAGVEAPGQGERFGAAFRTRRGASRLERVAGPSPPPSDPDPPAP